MTRAGARAFLLGVGATLVAGAALATLVVASGVVDVAATSAGGVQDRILAYASSRSIAHHAADATNPLARDPAAVEAGLREYREMCVACHGAPGTHPEEFAAGMHPAPPDLASPQVQSLTDGMLYDVVARGVGSTGMPAFGATHSPEQIWGIVAFVRRLRALTPEQQAKLAQRDEGDEHHEHHGATAEPGATPARPADGAASAGARVHQVSISSFRFAPATVEARPGDVVEWRNEDFAAHTATASDGSFDTGELGAGASGRVVVKQKGRFPYSCRYHAAMKGTIVVE